MNVLLTLLFLIVVIVGPVVVVNYHYDRCDPHASTMEVASRIFLIYFLEFVVIALFGSR